MTGKLQGDHKDLSGPDDGIELTPRQKQLRRARSIALGVILAAFVVIVYTVTVAKLGVNVLNRPL